MKHLTPNSGPAAAAPTKPLAKGTSWLRRTLRCAAACLLLTLAACKAYYVTDTGAVRPKHNKFRLAGQFTLPDKSPIDTNSIYVYRNTLNGPAPVNAFIRFYRDGHAYIGSFNDKEDKTLKINDLSNIELGYYTLEGTRLTLEVFGFFYDAAGDYATYEGEIANGNVVLTKEKLRAGASRKLNEVFQKQAAVLKARPDW